MIKLTENDKTILLDFGYENKDFPQIELALRKTKYTTKGGNKISRKEVVEILGRKEFLSGIARSAFHWTATRISLSGQVVYFDSSRVFE